MRAKRTIKTLPPGRRRGAPGVLCLAALAAAVIAASCAKESKPSEPRVPRDVEAPEYLKDTVGELARFSGREMIPVQAYAFVTGLDGTGSKIVPPGIRQHILDIMRRHKVAEAEKLLADPNNAVVTVTGLMGPGINKGETFDLEVRAIPNTETTSLEGGFVLECDLTRVMSARGVEARSEVLALGRGGIFVSPFGTDKEGKATGDLRVGRILAGGKATKARHFKLVLLTPSVRTADQLVRTINTRFPGAAQGTADAGQIDLAVPKDFQDDKTRFLDLVGALYLRETPDARDHRINLLIETLQAGKDLDSASTCLEAFGPTVAPRLHVLADHPSAAVRFYVGRTLADLQDARAVGILERVVQDEGSEFQEQAVSALGKIQSGLGLGVLNRAFNVKNARVRVAAWQATARLAPRSYVARVFENKFVLSVVPTRGEPFIYVARTLRPQIAIFGNVTIRPPILADTRRATATAIAEASSIQLISHCFGLDERGESPLDIKSVIEKLALPLPKPEEPEPPAGGARKPEATGLGLGYSDVVGLLHEMSRKGAISAPLVLQPLVYQIPGDRPVARPIAEPGPGEPGPGAEK